MIVEVEVDLVFGVVVFLVVENFVVEVVSSFEIVYGKGEVKGVYCLVF